ncbi:hypothetical protein PCANC_25059 [Puccinia coronata f. sp. avenae]|uniref:Uncharacterized protein n=1 Tax=Puccinia coronata f. sp. avenae TaxID=200324 RepID=A0A2N5S5X9_9BASI|nr:hypothetical protein PCANC_25059 [Puccinia coronata f. sp. avenae]
MITLQPPAPPSTEEYSEPSDHARMLSASSPLQSKFSDTQAPAILGPPQRKELVEDCHNYGSLLLDQNDFLGHANISALPSIQFCLWTLWEKFYTDPRIAQPDTPVPQLGKSTE